MTGAGLLLGYRAYASLADRHLSLERLYRFTQAVTSAPEVDEIIGNVLREAKELLRAERAEVAFVASDGGDVAHVPARRDRPARTLRGSPELRRTSGCSRASSGRRAAADARGTRDPDERRWLDAQVAREAVVVPLRGGAGILGVLVVADRLGDVRTFDDDDVRLLETVANHASVALQNGELIDQLRHEALHDALTGLPNRRLCSASWPAALDEVADGRSPGAAVMILDLDGFKEVNDTLGHQHGDELLDEVGTRLRDRGRRGRHRRPARRRRVRRPAARHRRRGPRRPGRPPAAARRWSSRSSLDGPRGRGRRRRSASRSPRRTPPTRPRCSSGPTWRCTTPRPRPRGLRVYEPDLRRRQPAPADPGLRAARRAAATASIEVHVQPQARLAHRRGRRRRGARPLEPPGARARSPPDEFIPLAERSGLIGPLTTRVLDASLAAVRRLAGGRARPRRRGEPLRPQPARRRPRRRGRPAAAPARRPRRPADPRGHRELGHGRPGAGRRRCCTSCATSASACRSTTSAPATRRCPTCSGCRCRRSRSTAASSPT